MLKPLAYSIAFAATLAACNASIDPSADAQPADSPAKSPPTAPAPAAPGATPAPDANAASDGPGAGLADRLARVAPDSAIDTPEARALLAGFPDGCANEPRLPFEQTCQHYAPNADANDPSPWPDVVVGIDEGRVVALALLNPAMKPGAGWQCDAIEGVEGVRVCAASGNAGNRETARKAWQAFFSAAD